MKRAYKIDDPCWIYVDDVLCKGRVVLSFLLTGCPTMYYVVKLDDEEFMHLEVRDAYCMSDKEDGLPPVTIVEDTAPSSIQPKYAVPLDS